MDVWRCYRPPLLDRWLRLRQVSDNQINSLQNEPDKYDYIETRQYM